MYFHKERNESNTTQYDDGWREISVVSKKQKTKQNKKQRSKRKSKDNPEMKLPSNPALCKWMWKKEGKNR